MPLSVERLKEGGETAWDEYVCRSQGGSIFHLTGWKRAVERSFGFQADYLLTRDKDRIRGVLPVFRAPSLPFGKILLSVPFAVYGGICADDEEAEKVLFREGRDLLQNTGGRYLEMRHRRRSTLDLPTKDLYATFRRSILETEQANMDAIPRKERAEIRKGKKNGLISRVGGEEVLDAFYDVYAHSVRNLGSPVFPKRWFAALLWEFGERCRILTVWHRERMVAGVLTLFFDDQVLPYYGGAYRDAFHLSANDVMYWDLLCYGLENGYKVFDFGRSKKGSGSYRFKEHWGFVPEPLRYQYHLPSGIPMPNVSPANPKYSLAISLWKRLPLSMTKTTGPWLSRYFA